MFSSVTTILSITVLHKFFNSLKSLEFNFSSIFFMYSIMSLFSSLEIFKEEISCNMPCFSFYISSTFLFIYFKVNSFDSAIELIRLSICKFNLMISFSNCSFLFNFSMSLFLLFFT